jgi:outer membrane protein OmpA-like peptidoglycan-associated protein
MRRFALGGVLISICSIAVLLSGQAYAYTAKDVRDWDNAPAAASPAAGRLHASCDHNDFVANAQGVMVHPKCDRLQVCLAPECHTITSDTGGGGGSAAAPAFNGDLKLTFETNSANLTDSDKSELRDFAAGVKDSAHHYHIDGYTDASGSVSYNVKLSRMRAESAVEYLVSLGVGRERLKAQGHGPLGGASDDASHRLVVARKSPA